ncbi:type II secretion system protein GspM [Saccharospirillum impatiens]|uniref:type II secretion system protein GspM n=1 Tax=Saccharospirillum impatiens TaxID=169438 RepID=UPI0003FAE9C1|nr:type II secretion system protein M [Saccharospirillum impatiens]
MTVQTSSWLEPLTLRWQGLPTRDRRALSLLLITAGLLVLWLGIINPTLSWRESTRSDLRAAEETFRQLVERAPLAMASSGSSAQAPTAGGSLNAEVRNQANRFGVVIQSFEPDGEQIRVRVDTVRFTNLMRWLGALEARGIDAAQLTLEATDRAGQVSVQASFRR